MWVGHVAADIGDPDGFSALTVTALDQKKLGYGGHTEWDYYYGHPRPEAGARNVFMTQGPPEFGRL